MNTSTTDDETRRYVQTLKYQLDLCRRELAVYADFANAASSLEEVDGKELWAAMTRTAAGHSSTRELREEGVVG